MKRTGAHHLGLATYDYEGIVDFYTRVLGWEIAWQDLMHGPDGTVHMKHVFFDTGDGSYVSYMCPTADMPNFPKKWATDINSGLGVMNGAYHFAFWADSRRTGTTAGPAPRAQPPGDRNHRSWVGQVDLLPCS